MKIVNFKFAQDLVEEAVTAQATQKEIQKIVRSDFKKKKEELLNNFLNHEVSLEISNPDLGNITGTLGGYGDLFGFIGFFKDKNPIEGAYNVLKNSIALKQIQIKKDYPRDIRGRFVSGKQTKNVKIIFSITDLNDFDDTSADVVREESTRNWVKGIEKGISAFNRYANYPRGVSGRGVQVKGPIRNPSVERPQLNSYRPTPYVSAMLKEFVNKIRGI